jgi:cyclopropane fatty-acyl-phospholipid synthase-like methyltransferase
VLLGVKKGRLTNRDFHLHRCLSCQFAFVSDPWTDYESIYSEDYYRGLGADPYIDYIYESQHESTTIRNYEWRGILANIQALAHVGPGTRWLDFGCGQGGLLKYCECRVEADYCGFEEGWLGPEASRLGFPIVRHSDLLADKGPFDIITAVEVFEHIESPIPVFRLLRRLLKPGGLLFYTTGNPVPHWNRFLNWEYVYPEIHVSFFSPVAMDRALAQSGFRTKAPGDLPGYSDIIRYKILKRLGVKDRHVWEAVLPWNLISRAIDARLRITGYPVATV